MGIFGNKLVPIKSVIVDPKLYPRSQTNWQTAYEYSQAMKAGAKFDPIVVAELDGALILVDGAHRLQAHKNLKETTVEVEELRKGMTRDEIYVEAVRRNAQHGQKLSTFERRQIIIRLQDMKMNLADISALVGVPANAIANFVATSVATTPAGQTFVLKKAFKHLAGKILPQKASDSNNEMQNFGEPQVTMLDNVIELLESNTIDWKNPKVMEKLARIRELVDERIVRKRGRPKKEVVK